MASDLQYGGTHRVSDNTYLQLVSTSLEVVLSRFPSPTASPGHLPLAVRSATPPLPSSPVIPTCRGPHLQCNLQHRVLAGNPGSTLCTTALTVKRPHLAAGSSPGKFISTGSFPGHPRGLPVHLSVAATPTALTYLLNTCALVAIALPARVATRWTIAGEFITCRW